MPDPGVRAWAAHDKAVLPGLDIAIAATACDAHRLGEQHARTECHDGVELTPIHGKSVRAAYRPGLSAAVPFQALVAAARVPVPWTRARLPFHEKSANSAPRLSYRHTPTGNGRVGQVEALGRQRLHVGRVELVPEPSAVRFARLRGNLIACRFLLAAVLLAQLADVLTTQIALGRGFVETNGVLLSLAHGSEVGAVALKLVAVIAVLTLALIRLPARRARVAVVLALALSAIGPIANVAGPLGR